METLKRTLLILLVLVLVGGSAYGAFYFLKKYSQTTPSIPAQISTSTSPAIPGFVQESNDKIPAAFPKGLISEKDITPIESFSVKSTSDTQYTYRYVTQRSFAENYSYFFTFVRGGGWETKGMTRVDSSWFLDFSKGREYLSISYSLNTKTKQGIIDISLTQKTNE